MKWIVVLALIVIALLAYGAPKQQPAEWRNAPLASMSFNGSWWDRLRKRLFPVEEPRPFWNAPRADPYPEA